MHLFSIHIYFLHLYTFYMLHVIFIYIYIYLFYIYIYICFIYIYYICYICYNSSDPHLFLKRGGKWILITFLREGGESEKLKKRGRNINQGKVFLKGGGWHFRYLIFSRLISFTFSSYFSELSKNEPARMCKEGWCFGLRQEAGSLCEGGGNCPKYLKRRWNRKEGSGKKF